MDNDQIKAALFALLDEEFLLSAAPHYDRSPLAALGRDGQYRHFGKGEYYNVLGLYSPPRSADQPKSPFEISSQLADRGAFLQGDLGPDHIGYGQDVTDGATASTLPHEMMHRGLQRLWESPEGQALRGRLRRVYPDHTMIDIAESMHWPDRTTKPLDQFTSLNARKDILAAHENAAAALSQRLLSERLASADADMTARWGPETEPAPTFGQRILQWFR